MRFTSLKDCSRTMCDTSWHSHKLWSPTCNKVKVELSVCASCYFQQHHSLAEKQILMTTVDVCVIMFTWLLMTAIWVSSCCIQYWKLNCFSGVGTCSGVTTLITLVFIVIIQCSAFGLYKPSPHYVLTESTISSPWHRNDPKSSPDFSPQLWDKIWECPGYEATSTIVVNTT